MISITLNANIVARNLGNIARDLPKNNKEALTELAILGRDLAKGLSPTKKGEMGGIKGGITYKVFKDRAEVTSRVFKTFPYHFWVNRDPIPALNIKSVFNSYFKVGQRVVYGGSAISAFNSPIKWTGVGGYFNVTAEVLKQKFGKRFSIAVEKTLRKNKTR